jgi:hypothetical protein
MGMLKKRRSKRCKVAMVELKESATNSLTVNQLKHTLQLRKR